MGKIQAGKYRARAWSVDKGRTETKDTPYIEVQFRLTDGPFAGENIEWRGYLSDGAKQRTVESLFYCGCWTSPGQTDGDLFDLEGIDKNEVELVVEPEEYNGKTYMRVKWVNDPSRSGPKPSNGLSEETKNSIRESCRPLILRLRQEAAARAVRNGTSDPDSEPAKKDDIPF